MFLYILKVVQLRGVVVTPLTIFICELLVEFYLKLSDTPTRNRSRYTFELKIQKQILDRGFRFAREVSQRNLMKSFRNELTLTLTASSNMSVSIIN